MSWLKNLLGIQRGKGEISNINKTELIEVHAALEVQKTRVFSENKRGSLHSLNQVILGYIDLENEYGKFERTNQEKVLILKMTDEQKKKRPLQKIDAKIRFSEQKVRTRINIVSQRLAILLESDYLVGEETKRIIRPVVKKMGDEVRSTRSELGAIY